MVRLTRDENRIPLIGALSATDSTTIVPLEATASSASLNVHMTGSDIATGGTSAIDDSAFTAGTTTGTPAMGFFSADTVDAGDTGALAMDASRRLLVSIEVDNVGIGGGTQYDIQDAQGATDTGSVALVVRNDALADLSGGDGAYSPLQVNASGALYIQEGSALSVTESSPISGFATATKQLADGHAVTIDNLISNEVYVRGSGTAGSADAAVLTVQGVASMTALSVTESSPISGFATSTKQLAAGHDVTVDNISTNEVFVRGGGTAGSPTDGEVVVIQGIAGADAVAISGAVTTTGTVALTNDSVIGDGDPTIDSITQFAINLNAGANQVLVSSAANKQIWVYAVAYTCSVAGTVSFQDELDTAITGIMDHAANSGLAVGPSGNFSMPLWKLATDKDLEVDVVTAAIDGFITYAIVSV